MAADGDVDLAERASAIAAACASARDENNSSALVFTGNSTNSMYPSSFFFVDA